MGTRAVAQVGAIAAPEPGDSGVVNDGVPSYIAPVDAPRSVHLWKALAPHVYLEEELFAFDAAAPDRDAEAFVEVTLPEANPFGRAA